MIQICQIQAKVNYWMYMRLIPLLLLSLLSSLNTSWIRSLYLSKAEISSKAKWKDWKTEQKVAKVLTKSFEVPQTGAKNSVYINFDKITKKHKELTSFLLH